MADIGGLYALGAALGAAGVGAVAGGFVQRAKGRQDTALVELQRRQLEEDRRRLSADLALEANATARSAERAWLSGVERVLQAVELGRPIDIDRFDEEFNQLQSELTQAMYRLATATAAVPQAPAGGSVGVQPYIERIAETALLVRSDLLRIISGLPPLHGSSDLRSLSRLVGTELHIYADLRTERLLAEYGNVRYELNVTRGRASERRVEQLRSELASAQADEAIRDRLRQTAAAHDQALTSVQERIEARGSIHDLEVSLHEAEIEVSVQGAEQADHAERRQREISRALLVEQGKRLAHQTVDIHRALGLPAQSASTNSPSILPAVAPRETTADAEPRNDKPGRESGTVTDNGE